MIFRIRFSNRYMKIIGDITILIAIIGMLSLNQPA
jgi:hypothetical protein